MSALTLLGEVRSQALAGTAASAVRTDLLALEAALEAQPPPLPPSDGALLLSSTQREAYAREGVLLLPSLLDGTTVRALNADVERLLLRARGLRSGNTLFDLEDTHRADDPRVRRIKRPDLHGAVAFAALLRDETLIGLSAQLLGTQHIKVANVKLNMKSPGYGAAVELHQDWAFYPHTNQSLLAVGVFLDDVGADNAPLLVWPHTHDAAHPTHAHTLSGAADGALFVGGVEARAAVVDLGAARHRPLLATVIDVNDSAYEC